MPATQPRFDTPWLSRHCAWAAAVISTALLCGCAALFGGSAPQPKESSDLEIQVEASALVNPDDNGRPSPVLVRIYELRNEALFLDADFFGLYTTDRTVLQGDLLAVDQFILRPGETRTLRRKRNLQAAAVGVLAAYRDLPNATWRGAHRLPAPRDVRWYSPLLRDERIRLQVRAQGKVVSIADLTAGAPGGPFANTPTASRMAVDRADAAAEAPVQPTATVEALPQRHDPVQQGRPLQDLLKLSPTK